VSNHGEKFDDHDKETPVKKWIIKMRKVTAWQENVMIEREIK